MTKEHHKSNNQYSGKIRIAILVVVIIVLGYFILRDSTIQGLLKQTTTKTTGDKKATPAKPGAPTPTPTPTKLKSGKETYNISQSDKTKIPNIPSLTLEPLDIKNGDKQTITVKANSNVAVQSVSIEYQSDTKKRTLPLSLSKGTATDGEWSTTWTLDDSVLYKYILTITATDQKGKSIVIVAPRS